MEKEKYQNEKIMKYSPKYFYLKWRVKKDQRFLLSEGLRKAAAQGLELHIGDNEYLNVEGKESSGQLRVREYEEGPDIREIIALVADDFPKVTRRYLDNREKLI
jgi:hypothetical protein